LLLVLAALAPANVAAAEMTACDLNHRTDIGNRIVSATVRIGFTTYGSVLLSDSCPSTCTPRGDTTPVTFTRDPRDGTPLRETT
jgi:hypothetical protein